MEYRFTEKGHRHELLVDGEWKALTGVTTVLGVIAKPALIQWAANMAVDYVEGKIKEAGLGTLINNLVLAQWLTEARKAHQRKKEEAGQKGTDVHALIEEMIKAVIGATEYKFEKSENPQVQHFIDWAVNNKVKFLESEVGIYSEELWTGGIVDIVCEIDGEVWIGDIKTGSGIYAEAFYQCAAYQIMLEEMKKYDNIKGHIILNLKKDGSFDEKRSISNEDNKQAFLSALSLYRISAKVNGALLNK